MKIEKKHVVIAGLSVISVAAAYAYYQYTQLLQYIIGFKSVKVKKISETLVNLDLFLNFTNKADAGFTINSQDYDVYINDMFVSKVVNYSKVVINPKNVNDGVSVVAVNIKFNPREVLKKLGKNPLDLISNPGAIRLRVPMKLKVSTKLFGINVNPSADYEYNTTIKELLTPTPQ